MINLDRKEYFNDLISTLFKRRLEVFGVFKFFVREKAVIKLERAEIPRYCFFVATESGDIGKTITVSMDKYEKFKVNECFGECCVLRSTTNPHFIMVCDNDNPEEAINSAVRKARGSFIFIAIIILIFLGSALLFFYPFLYTLK